VVWSQNALVPVAPTDSYETKARHLRWFFRRRPSDAELSAEYERLFPDGEPSLGHIVVNAWTEGRELAGWTRDEQLKRWHRADGTPVLEDTGEEWAHL
jgi:hypothetical protein